VSAVPPRAEIRSEFTWNAPSVFASVDEWEAERQAVLASLDEVRALQGRLGESPELALAGLQAMQMAVRRAMKVLIYGLMEHHVNMAEPAGAGRYGQGQGLVGQVVAAIGFVDPELLAIGRGQLDEWLAQAPALAGYRHYLDDLFRRQAHVRSAEVEQLLGALREPFAGAASTAGLLTSADLKFAPARNSQGEAVPLTQSKYRAVLAEPDREARRTAWESYLDAHLAFQNTLANNLATSIRQNVFTTRARGYPSTLEGSLFENNIPVAVFHNLIETYRQNLPTWHRYWAVRRKALGVETLQPYDIWAPLTGAQPRVPYEQAVDWICAGLAPLGEDYGRVLRAGCLEDRWVDIYPNQGKADGAFSAGSQGTHPFILMSYQNNLLSMSTLAHELGHSMHSYLTWQSQPFVYASYSLFVAEVASNFNQAMVRGHLLAANPDRDFQIALVEEAMSNFHRYFFIMPTLARFELETHQRAERGQALTAADMNALMADLFAEGYGSEVPVDRDRVGITWATFGHLFQDYYVYQYATGIAGANALARRIRAGEPGAPEAYLRFLKAGSSLYPLDALKLAGVDLTTPEPVEETFAVLAGLVERLEQLFA
jgi:oligoendopeptidase F